MQQSTARSQAPQYLKDKNIAYSDYRTEMGQNVTGGGCQSEMGLKFTQKTLVMVTEYTSHTVGY